MRSREPGEGVCEDSSKPGPAPHGCTISAELQQRLDPSSMIPDFPKSSYVSRVEGELGPCSQRGPCRRRQEGLWPRRSWASTPLGRWGRAHLI